LTINSPNKIGLNIRRVQDYSYSSYYGYSYYDIRFYFHSLKVGILTINCKAHQPNLAFYTTSSSYIPPIFQNYVEDHSCIFSLNYVIRSVPIKAYLYLNLAFAMNSEISFNNRMYDIYAFCITSCP
jgi:hypothetical protein